MRTAFINQLILEAKTNKKIFLLTGDLGFNVIEPYIKLFPDRFINVGIAEQNMVGIASGLAMEGYCVYIYSIGNFPTLRCIEQIRYDVCYHNLNVKIIAVGGGFAYGSLGASHHATEEIGMLRTIPNLVVCAPGDPFEAKAIANLTSKYNGPCYVRLGKAGEPVVHKKEIEKIDIGDVLKIREGGKTAVFSTGAMLKYVIDFIYNNDLESSIYSFPFIKPINQQKLIDIIESHNKIITIEEHQAQCGFGSAILEIINDLRCDNKLLIHPAIKRIAIKDKFFPIAGSQEYLRIIAGLELSELYFK